MRTVDGTFRTAPEREAFSAATFYSATHGLSSPPERAYLDVLPRARLGILHRVIGNMLREPVDGLVGPFITSSVEADLAAAFPRLDPIGPERVTLQSRPDGCAHVAAVGFPTARTVLAVPLAGVHGYDRVSPVGEPEAHSAAGVDPISHPSDVTALIEREGCVRDTEQIARFEAELAESVANLALAYLAEDVLEEGYGGIDTLRTLGEADPAPDPTTFLERIAAVEERPTNPSSKIRRGMTISDSFVYAPEFSDRIDLRFVAVRSESAAQFLASGEPPMTERLCATFDGLERAVRRSLPAAAELEDYTVIPVHPWQFYHTLRSGIPGAGIRPVEGFAAPAAPLLNLRTVVPYPDADDPKHRAHLKLAIDVQKTSSVRTIPPDEIHDGPRITDVVEEIDDREGFDSLGFLTEPAGVHYRPTDDGGPDAESLAVLVRMNPYEHRTVDESSMPVSAASLLAPLPPGGRPLVMSLIDEFGSANGITARRDAAGAFLDSYLEVLVPDQLTVLTKYGIGLDMHMQNTCMVFDDEGVPTGALFRDFGGVRIIPDRLAAHGIDPDLVDGSAVVSTVSGAHRNIVNSTLQTHVGELIRVVVEHTALDESECWARLGRLYRRTFERLDADDGVEADWIDHDRSVLFGETALHDSRMGMRLEGLPRNRAVIEVSNPLAARRQPSREGS